MDKFDLSMFLFPTEYTVTGFKGEASFGNVFFRLNDFSRDTYNININPETHYFVKRPHRDSSINVLRSFSHKIQKEEEMIVFPKKVVLTL